MDPQQRQVVGQIKRGAPLVLWPLLGVAVLALVGVLIPLLRGKTVIATPSETIGPYERIEASDITTKKVWRYGLDEADVATAPSQIIGREPQTALAPGSPIHLDHLTKAVGTGELKGVQLELAPDQSSALGVDPGDRVILRLAPTGDSADLRPFTGSALLVDQLEGSDSDSPTEYVVVVPANEAKQVANLAARSALILTPAD
jgi:SAF domain